MNISPDRSSFSASALIGSEDVDGVSVADVEALVASLTSNDDVDTFNG